jgi:tetratricopeptide (TPR) repeat protein
MKTARSGRAISALLWSLAALSVWALLAPASPARAETLREVFERGNAAYFRGELEEAAQAYEQLIALGVEDPDVSFNLATAHARLGHYGQAIRYYERTLRLRPGDEAAEAALRTCRTTLGRRRAEREGEAEVSTAPPLGEAIFGSFSVDLLAWLSFGLNLLFFGLLLLRSLTRRDTLRLGLAIGAPIVGLLLVFFATGLSIRSGVFDEGEKAIVLREEAPLYEGPDPRSEVRRRVLEGERAAILGREGAYAHVRLSGGREGWLADEDVGEI